MVYKVGDPTLKDSPEGVWVKDEKGKTFLRGGKLSKGEIDVKFATMESLIMGIWTEVSEVELKWLFCVLIISTLSLVLFIKF